MRKRGRKTKDSVDCSLEIFRSNIKRGFRHCFPDIVNESTDSSIRKVLSRELEILKTRLLVEIRETNNIANEDGDCPMAEGCVNGISGSPVCARLILPQISIMNCLVNSMNQIVHAKPTQTYFSFTPECHVLLGKACELLVIELSCRAFADGLKNSIVSDITKTNLAMGIRGSGKAGLNSGGVNQTISNPFDFLMDLLDSELHSESPLDVLAKIHSDENKLVTK